MAQASEKCKIDLIALASWPSFTVDGKLDLPFSHAAHILSTALGWRDLGDELRERILDGLVRLVHEGLSCVSAHYFTDDQVSDLVSLPCVHFRLHNISLISLCALATAAELCGCSKSRLLSATLLTWLKVRFERYRFGFTEGVSYDGYLATFVANWLFTQNADTVDCVLSHPGFQDLLEQCRVFSCPSNFAASAEIGDVEPAEMPFVWSALAKLQLLRFCPKREEALKLIDPSYFRGDALWSRITLLSQSEEAEMAGSNAYSNGSSANFLKSNAGISLQSLPDELDVPGQSVKVVASLCSSPMSHIQKDNGTVVIGHKGSWWIADPGYQQYLETSERNFTLGLHAHNIPAINGFVQTKKVPRLLQQGRDSSGATYALIDLTDCYPADLGAKSVVRVIWVLGEKHVAVCDVILSDLDLSIDHTWHGHPEAYWGAKNGSLFLTLDSHPDATCWIGSPDKVFSIADIQRLKGSRGHQSLHCQSTSAINHWWVFSFSKAAPKLVKMKQNSLLINDDKVSLTELAVNELSPSLVISIGKQRMVAHVLVLKELIGIEASENWVFRVWVNGRLDQECAAYASSKIELFPPMINADDNVVVCATQSSVDESSSFSATYAFNEEDINELRAVPLRVVASVDGSKVIASSYLLPDAIPGEIEYAFYLMIDGKKEAVAWYTGNSTHTFELKDEWLGQKVAVRGFARAQGNNDLKMSKTSNIISDWVL